jgi:hypothetical protein
VLGWHVQQQGLCEAALRAFEAERIPRIKEVFGLTDKHAEKMKAGVWAGLLGPVVALGGFGSMLVSVRQVFLSSFLPGISILAALLP